MCTRSLRHIGGYIAVLAATALGSACAVDGAKSPVPSPGGAAWSAPISQSGPALPFVLPNNVREVCPKTGDPAVAYCEALVRNDVRFTSPSGYGPSDLQSAYNLRSATGGNGQIVAVVDAYDDPNVEADLFVYRNTFKLPVCSTLNGCFIRVNQKGKAHNYPPPNADWAIETSLDIDTVSATYPNCKILLVEANTNSWTNLGASVDEAVALGAHIVSNSYGAMGKGARPRDYDHPSAIIIAAGGDGGYYGNQDQEPADFPTVVAVGGTHLTRGGGQRGWTETVWGGTGSGCSTFAKPSWQTDTGCAHRTANDIAAVADPATGVAVYDSYQQSGWLQVGGTSVGSPLNASVFALAGNASQLNAAQSFYQPANRQYLYDITVGANGSCSPTYLCTAHVGYDGPTGWGTPNGVGAY